MAHLESKHTLFDGVGQMLAPGSLSDLLSKSITRVSCRPMEDHHGLAGGRLEYVETDNGRYVLKHMAMAHDWMMFSTDDYECRAVRLWQYGLLDQLLPHAHHKIIAAAREGENWAILMEDLTGNCLNFDNMSAESVITFTDTLARIHATFWQDTRLADTRLGLCTAARDFDQYHRAHKYFGQDKGMLPDWVRIGWDVMKDLLDVEVYEQMVAFEENPEPFLDALNRYPKTLVHGDYRVVNFALADRPIVFDWQLAAQSLMTVDLAFFFAFPVVDMHRIGKDRLLQYYRERLETYLNQKFGDTEWQTMVDLGFAVNAFFSTCYIANIYKSTGDPNKVLKKRVQSHGQIVMNVLHWL